MPGLGLGSKFLRLDLNRWYLTQFPNYSRPIGLSPLDPKTKPKVLDFKNGFVPWRPFVTCCLTRTFLFHQWAWPIKFVSRSRGTWGGGNRELHIMWCEPLYIHVCRTLTSALLLPCHWPQGLYRRPPPNDYKVSLSLSLYLPRVMNTSPSLIDSRALSDTFLICCFFMCWFSLKCLNYPPIFFNYTCFKKWL